MTTKAEFGQTFLGESGKVELNHETGYFNFEFTCSLMVTGSDPMVLDEIAQTPVVGKCICSILIVIIFVNMTMTFQAGVIRNSVHDGQS